MNENDEKFESIRELFKSLLNEEIEKEIILKIIDKKSPNTIVRELLKQK